MSLITRFLLLFSLAIVLAPAPFARAQGVREGVVRVLGWPESAEPPERLRGYDMLPYVDTLTIGYRYGIAGGSPLLSLALDWTPGRYGLLDGRRVDYERLPAGLRLVGLAFRADVYSGGAKAAEIVVSVDSMIVGPAPDFGRVELEGLSWDALFVDTPADAARALFEAGFELRDPEVLRAAFAAFEEETAPAASPRVSARRAPRTVVYERDVYVDLFFSLDWLAGLDGRDAPPRQRLSGEPRGSAGGRGSLATGRGRSRTTGEQRGGETQAEGERGSSRGKRGAASDASKDDDERSGDDRDEDERDDNDLVPAAVAAFAAVGVLAYAGGTVGYYGNARHAPIGLSAGFVRERWGVLLQSAVNEALLGSGDGPRRLVAKFTAFGSARPRARIHPAVGAGVLATEEDDVVSAELSLSLGAVGTFGPVVVQAGYDLVQGGVELGLAFNFRSPSLRKRR